MRIDDRDDIADRGVAGIIRIQNGIFTPLPVSR